MVYYLNRQNLFKYKVDLFEKTTLIDFIHKKICRTEKTVIAHMNLHAIACLLESDAMTALFSRPETYVHIDGMPIVWLLRLKAAPVNRTNRLTYLDWGNDLLAHAAAEGWRVAYIGSSREVCDKAVAHFQAHHSAIILRGWDGYFDMEDKRPDSNLSRMIGEINVFKPDLLIVGMGMPRQEIFFQHHFENISFKVGLCCGAFFEYYVGGQAMPPRWLGQSGLEWLYRLLHNPKRYAYRYLIEPARIIYLLAKRKAKGE